MAIEINKHITHLLGEHDCVIVPGFGALLLQYKPATIDKNTGVLCPPAKIIAFNEKLQSNDWMLVNAVATKSHITVEVAEEQINGFVKLLRGKLLLNKKYEWENVGIFYLNDGHLKFESDSRVNYNGDSFGLPQIFVTKKESVLKTSPVVKQRSAMSSQDTSKIVVEKPTFKTPVWAWVLLPLFLVAGVMGFMWENRGNPAYSSLNPFANVMPKNEEKLAKKKEDFNYEDPLGENTSGEKIDKSEEVNIQSDAPKEVVIEAPVAKEEPSTEPVDQEVIKKSAVVVPSGTVIGDKTGRCYIILASFSTLEQAEEVRKKLENEGMEEAKIIEPHDSKNIYRVSIADFDKKTDALQRAQALKEKYGDKLWVHIY